MVDSPRVIVPVPLNDSELEQIAMATLLIGRPLTSSDVSVTVNLSFPRGAALALQKCIECVQIQQIQ
jgi:hypothetical protein